MIVTRLQDHLSGTCRMVPDSCIEYKKEAVFFENEKPSSLSLFFWGMTYTNEQEIYKAAFKFYEWIFAEQQDYSVVFVKPPDMFYTKPRLDRGTWPILSIFYNQYPFPDTPTKRAMTLWDMMEVFTKLAKSSDNAKNLMESVVLALCKYHGKCGSPGAILPRVEIALQNLGWSNQQYVSHLKAAQYALELLKEDKPIPLYLRKFAGDNDAYLIDKFCSNPFDRFDVVNADPADPNPRPFVRVCCQHWLPTPIGYMDDDLENILNSSTAQKIRQSVTDGTFRYCDHLNCRLMAIHTLQNKTTVTDPIHRKAIDEKEFKVSRVKEILFGIDETCNLACPSCRTHVRGLKHDQIGNYQEMTNKIVLPLLKTAESILINPSGELFVSYPSKRILEFINDETCPNLKVNIITNGTLFNQQNWDKYPGIHNKVGYVRISLDSCKKRTYEKLRRGANYEKTLENLRFISRLLKEKAIEGVFYAFTYQLDNFEEMPDFVLFAKELNSDGVHFERLMNMGAFSDEEYLEKAVHLNSNPRHADFLQIIQHPILRDPIVMGDIPGLLDEK